MRPILPDHAHSYYVFTFTVAHASCVTHAGSVVMHVVFHMDFLVEIATAEAEATTRTGLQHTDRHAHTQPLKSILNLT